MYINITILNFFRYKQIKSLVIFDRARNLKFSSICNFIMSSMKDNNKPMVSNDDDTNDNHRLFPILQQLTTTHLHSLIIHPIGNKFLLHLLQPPHCHPTFINHLLLSLTTYSRDHFLPISLHYLGLVPIYIFFYFLFIIFIPIH